jgi:Spy/CpxP family protein refolding chaperone
MFNNTPATRKSQAGRHTMKRWIKRTLFGLFGAGLLVGGLSACSHGGFGHHARGPMTDEQVAKFRERATERVSSQLKLDEAQKAKFGLLLEAMNAQRKALMAGSGGADLRTEGQALLAGDKFDRTKAQALVNAKTSAVNEQSPAVINAAADFFDSLNAEQKQQVRDFLARRGGHHGWRG